MSLESLRPVLAKSESSLTLEEFHHQVNLIFHDIESQTYDVIHSEMWFNLFEQFKLVVSRIHSFKTLPDKVTLLDIGCGTGLATGMLLEAGLGQQVQEVILSDVSPKMMEKAEERAQTWGVQISTYLGDISGLNRTADLVVMSSLLHHIPDVPQFLRQVQDLVNPGGFLIHIHDPNGDFLNDHEYLERKELLRSVSKRSLWEMINYDFIPVRRLKNILNSFLGRKTHIELTNDQLIRDGVVKKRLKADEIWSITDIHVEDLPFSTQKGISLVNLKEVLSDFDLIHAQSYGFFGKLLSELPDSLKVQELDLMRQERMNGRYLGAVWKKKN